MSYPCCATANISAPQVPALSRAMRFIRMIGGLRAVADLPGAPARPGAVVLSARDLTLEPQFHNVSFDLRGGEISESPGLVGSAAASWLRHCRPHGGELRAALDRGVRGEARFPTGAMSRGMALRHRGSQETGCFLRLSVLENLEIAVLKGASCAAGRRKRAVRRPAQR